MPQDMPEDAPGVVSGKEVEALIKELAGLLAAHRVWERFPAAPAWGFAGGVVTLVVLW
jgi:hypothetical protein